MDHEDGTLGLAAQQDFDQGSPTFPFGAHIAVVEVTTTPGAPLLRHIAVDDCGTVLNPLLVEGQQHGAPQGRQPGIRARPLRRRRQPADRQLHDYALPSAGVLPSAQLGIAPDPLGAKGIGEASTIGSTPAVQNAVIGVSWACGTSTCRAPASGCGGPSRPEAERSRTRGASRRRCSPLAAGQEPTKKAWRPRKNLMTTVYRARLARTLDPANPTADHVAVDGGRIVAVGGAAGMPAGAPVDERFADKVLVPGFVEGHTHTQVGALWSSCYCGRFARTGPDGTRWDELPSVDESMARLREWGEANPEAEVVFGWGFDPIYFGRTCTRENLDQVSDTRPVAGPRQPAHRLGQHAGARPAAAGQPAGHPVRAAAHGPPTGELRQGLPGHRAPRPAADALPTTEDASRRPAGRAPASRR